MSNKILFSTQAGIGGLQIAFVRHSDVTLLPDRPGLFALLGKRGDARDMPLYFGFATQSMLDQVPYDPGFAQAIRVGLVDFASAYVPGGYNPADLVRDLAVAYDAPINATATALAEIEQAQSDLHAQAMARRIAAQ